MKKIIILFIGIAAILAICYAVKTRLKTTPAVGENNQSSKTASTKRDLKLEIQDGKLVVGDPVVTVTQGDQIHMTVISNESDELHIHGYDIETELEAGHPAEINFTASMSGRFEAELHHEEKTVFALEVQPK